MSDAWRSIGEVAADLVQDILSGRPPKAGRPQVHDPVDEPAELPDLMEEAA